MKKNDSSRGGPEKRAATLDEVEAAYRALTTPQLARLDKYARGRVAALYLEGKGIAATDLLQEALTETLEGSIKNAGRKWYKDSVSFVGHLMGVMKSIASHPPKHLLPDHAEHILLESQVTEVTPDGEVRNPLLEYPSGSPDQERILDAKKMLEIVEQTFKDDAIVSLIIDGWRNGMSGPEIQEQLGITPKEFEAAVKRLRWTIKHKLKFQL